MEKVSVPVVMHHSIGIPNYKWYWSHLTCPYKIFEHQLKWLKNMKFHTISLQELYDYMNKGKDLPKNAIVITFDDGFLDNWIFAYPLLKKYGFKGTVYVSPDFVDPRNIIRNNLEDVYNGVVKVEDMDTIGYLSWDEIKKMEEDEIMDIQSHTMTHTWYPKSNKIIDFRHPGDSYIWMTWNENPKKKSSLQIDDEKLVNYGEPVYESGRAIGIKRYFPDKNLKMFMINYVKEKGGKDFFRNKSWKNELFEIARRYKMENHTKERYESEEEYDKRVYTELQKSKEIIEDMLQKEVRFLCWPGGAVTSKAINMALDIGYTSSTVGKDVTHQRKYMKNTYREDPSRINRFGTTLYWNGREGYSSEVKYKNGFYFVLTLYRLQERKIIAPLAILFLGGISSIYKLKFKKNKKGIETNKLKLFG